MIRQMVFGVLTVVIGVLAYWRLGVAEWQNALWGGLIGGGVMVGFSVLDLILNWDRIDWTKVK